MKGAALLLLAATALAPAEPSRTYLASIEGLALGPGDAVERVELETWGVTFEAVCRIPPGWRVEAGGNATPEGALRARGTHGSTWIGPDRLDEFDNLVLLTVHGPVRPAPEPVEGGVLPATFKGSALVYGPRGGPVALTRANVRLVPAKRCPDRA